MDEMNFYKTLYERELSRRYELDKLINIPITLISLNTGIIIYLLKNFAFDNCSNISSFFSFFIFITFGVIIASTIYIAFSFNNLFKGFLYKEFSYPQNLKNYYDKIVEFNKNNDKKEDFDIYLINKYINCSDNYTKINDKRSLNLYRAKTLIITSYFLTFICIILYIIKIYLI